MIILANSYLLDSFKRKFIDPQPDKAHFRHICELQLRQFSSTAAKVSRVDCLGNFTKNLDFI